MASPPSQKKAPDVSESAMAAENEREVGQREAPMGSNNSPRIAQYRTAVPGGPVGPWCAYFASWVSKQAGVPTRSERAGLRTRLGLVESVKPDGTIRTVEGNSSDQVARRTHRPGDAIGYVRLT